MTLAFSRAFAVIWARDRKETSWIASHTTAFRFLGGIPATVRPDNVKTASPGDKAAPEPSIPPTKPMLGI